MMVMITFATFFAVSFLMSSKHVSGNSDCGRFNRRSLKSAPKPTGTIKTFIFLEYSSSMMDERSVWSSLCPSAPENWLPEVINIISLFWVVFPLKWLAASFNAKSILLCSLRLCCGTDIFIEFTSTGIVSALSPYTTRAVVERSGEIFQ